MAHNAEQRAHQEAEVPLTVFLGSSEFGETVFENWERIPADGVLRHSDRLPVSEWISRVEKT
jgi:hypothetical protein